MRSFNSSPKPNIEILYKTYIDVCKENFGNDYDKKEGIDEDQILSNKKEEYEDIKLTKVKKIEELSKRAIESKSLLLAFDEKSFDPSAMVAKASSISCFRSRII